MAVLEQLGNLGDAVAGIAVLVSIIFLAKEVRANTNTMRAAAIRDVAKDWAELQQDMSQHPNRAVIISCMDPSFDISILSPDESAAFHYHMRGVLQRFQAEHALAEAGILESEVWEKHRGYCRSMLSYPATEKWWQNERLQPMYPDSFIEAIESAPLSEMPARAAHT